MSKIEFLKVEGHTHLVRDINSKAIVNTSSTEYDIYMKRHRARNEQSDQIRNACKEMVLKEIFLKIFQMFLSYDIIHGLH